MLQHKRRSLARRRRAWLRQEVAEKELGRLQLARLDLAILSFLSSTGLSSYFPGLTEVVKCCGSGTAERSLSDQRALSSISAPCEIKLEADFWGICTSLNYSNNVAGFSLSPSEELSAPVPTSPSGSWLCAKSHGSLHCN